jgi:hypothetical protein
MATSVFMIVIVAGKLLVSFAAVMACPGEGIKIMACVCRNSERKLPISHYTALYRESDIDDGQSDTYAINQKHYDTVNNDIAV